jgi:hypothetical protein
MQENSFDLSAVYEKQGRPLRRFGLSGLGVSVAIAATVAYILWSGRTSAHDVPYLYEWGSAGIVVCLAFGVLVHWATSRGGVVRLTVDGEGLELRAPEGQVKRVLWSDPDISLQVWDASTLPESDAIVQNIAPCRFGLATYGMKRMRFRTGVPREAYLAVLEGARGHGLEVTRTEDHPDDIPTFRLHPPGHFLR